MRATRRARAGLYDQAYFDKWYRNPRYRVKSAAELSRQVAFVLFSAEYILGRTVRSVLDLGCGEGNWRAPLRSLRPRIRYHGVDASAYVVERFGRERNIRLGTIDALDQVRLPGRFDLILCVGVLNYLKPIELTRGLKHVYDRTGGVAYLELFTDRDRGVFGDTRAALMRPPSWYRARMRETKLVACGMHLYVPDWLREYTAALERCDR